MNTTKLPEALRPWAPTLSTMDVELATALGPLLKDLDDFISAATSTHPHQGEPDGFGGIGRRGEPERILVSEWALAEHFPHEFLRRAATGELLYTTPEFLEPHKKGKTAVLVDAGPDQLGAARLVQLAALIVLQRREPELVLGVLGDEPGTWEPASIGKLINARNNRRSTNDEVRRWARTVDDMWLLAGPGLAARRTLTSVESAWDDHGATAVRVGLNGLSTELTLPGRRHGVRLLRGNLRTPPPPAPTRLRFPSFPSAAGVLLARGGTDRELVVLRVLSGKQRTHTVPGRILAAAQAGKRLVTVIENDGIVKAHVIGNRSNYLNRFETTVEHLGIDPAAVAESGLAPLRYWGDMMLWRLGATWWQLTRDWRTVATDYTSVTPVEPASGPHWSVRPALFGPRLTATCEDGVTWKIRDVPDIVLPEGARPLALHEIDTDEPGIVYQEGLILRLRTATRTRTFTAWSGAPAVVHPTLPWVAVPRDDGRIEVGHLVTNQRIATMRGEP